MILHVVIYTESHPDRETEMIGVFSTEEKAEQAIEKDIAQRRKYLPHARVERWNYDAYERNLDNSPE